MQLHVVNDLAGEAARVLSEAANKSISDHGCFLLGVSGGSLATLLGSLGELGDLSKWHIFLVDERAVPLDHEDSNYRAVQTAWPASIKANWCPINETLLGDLNALAQDYENRIKTVLDAASVIRFDCLLLGLGPDGHTASLFPNHPDFLNNLESSKLVIPVRNSPKHPSERISLSPKCIKSAALNIFLIANSPAKAPVIQSIVRDSNSTYPPTLIAANAVWYIDAATAASLPQ